LCPQGYVIGVAFDGFAIGETENEARLVDASEKRVIWFEVGNVNFCKFL
jgi:hypothetical protein